MTVLVAPFTTVDWVIRHIPILGKMLGGMLIAVPVHVGGTVDNVIVVPLGPGAVGARGVEILSNTLGIPKDVIKYASPPAGGTGQPTTANPSGPK